MEGGKIIMNRNILAFQSEMYQELASLLKVIGDTCCRNVKFIKKAYLLVFSFTMRENTFLFLFSF